MTTLHRWAALAVAVGVGLSGLVLGAGPAYATDPTFEPDPSSVGSLTFYDASGNVITGGTLPADTTTQQTFAAWVVGSTNVHGTDTRATLFYATPDPGPTSAWATEPVNGVTTFNPQPAGLPAPLAGSTNPIWKGSATDNTLFQWSDPTDGVANTESGVNANIYQVRMYTNNPSPAGSSYDSADVYVDRTAHTWTVVYAGTPTSTALAVSPTSPVTPGTQETLTATVTSGIAGTVEFFDGTASLGTAPVSADQATLQATLPSGAHSLTATFTPTSTNNRPSTSNTVSYTVNATGTTTTLQVSPAGSAAAGSPVTLRATVLPSSAPGSVQFFDGSNNIGSHVVSGGSSQVTTSSLAIGSHSLSAHFVPTNTAVYSASQSSAQSYSITTGSSAGGTPTNTVVPTLSGTARAGTNESCGNGTWSDATSFTYAFSVGGAAVQADSSNAVLPLTGDMVGKQLACTVTAHGTGGMATATTAPVTVLIGAAPHPVTGKGPRITGTPKKGRALKCNPGTWTPKPSRFAYQWKRNGKPVKGAAKQMYKLGRADLGEHIACTVTAMLPGYAKGVATTKAVTAQR